MEMKWKEIWSRDAYELLDSKEAEDKASHKLLVKATCGVRAQPWGRAVSHLPYPSPWDYFYFESVGAEEVRYVPAPQLTSFVFPS